MNTDFVLRVWTNSEFADVVQAILETLGGQPAAWHDEDSGEARVEEYFPQAGQARERADRLRELLGRSAPDRLCRIEIAPLPRKKWQDAWKEFFHTERVSERIVVKPSWEHHISEPDDCVIEIDPGMSFGTGRHGTTRICIRFLDRLAGETAALPEKRTCNSSDSRKYGCIDIGCGSGILSITAAKLGLGPVLAIDIETDAVSAARRNCNMNGVDDQMSYLLGNIRELDQDYKANIVVANILAPVLIENAEKITAMTASGGTLILSGILTDEYHTVFEKYHALGMCEIARLDDGEWRGGMFRHTFVKQSLPRGSGGGGRRQPGRLCQSK